MRFHVRYRMMWGHKVRKGRGDPEDVTREEYNAAFGVESPEQPEIPECAYHAWEIWWRLNARRPTGENQTPISWSEMQSFCAMSGVVLLPDDVAMIEALDNAYLIAVSEERRGAFDRAREENKTEKPTKAKR
jgi:hypothetical protein